MLTDAEVLCEFMEPRPQEREDSDFEWWGQVWTNSVWKVFPRTITLNECHLIEERLTKEQRLDYWLYLATGGPPELGYWRILHVDAPTKVRALAAVLRPVVEGRKR